MAKSLLAAGGPTDYAAAIQALAARQLQTRAVIVASNRGPVEFHADEAGFVPHRGQGGLVTALGAIAALLPATWVAAPLTEMDRQLASSGRTLTVPGSDRHSPWRVRFICPEPAEYGAYYDTIANSLLWLLQHGVHHAPESPDIGLDTWAAWHAYRRVNRRFAEAIAAVAREAPDPPLVLLHDYHLYLVPALLRRQWPEATILHFTHIAWPSPEQWRPLPAAMRHSLLSSLLCCDHLGFNTPGYAEAFLATCAAYMPVEVRSMPGLVRSGGAVTRVKAYPVAVDATGLQAYARSDVVRRAERQLLCEADAPCRIVQVARTDPSKNLVRSLKALDLLLSRRPEWHGRVVFWGMLPASRQTAAPYRAYLGGLTGLAAAINRRYRQDGWQPIHLYLENDYARGIAAMKQYDVLLVNSLADGMNLVAKEGPLVNLRDGVLVLSETTGVSEELAPFALMVNPYDVHGTAQALHRALAMPRRRRAALAAAARAHLVGHDVFRWGFDQLRDVLAGEVSGPGCPRGG